MPRHSHRAGEHPSALVGALRYKFAGGVLLLFLWWKGEVLPRPSRWKSARFWMIGVEAVMPHGERLSRRAVIGLLIRFGGIIMLVWSDLGGEGASRQ